MIVLMIRWFRKICKVPLEKIKIHIHMHTLHSRENILEYWSDITKVPQKQFYRPYIKPTSLLAKGEIYYIMGLAP